MSPSVVYFDLFNTLVSVGDVPLHIGRLTADILGIDQETWNTACFGPAHEICRPTTHLQVLQAIAVSIDPAIPMERIHEAVEARQARFDHALCHVKTEILTTLEGLRRGGMHLALISNASSAEVVAWPKSPLVGLFDVTLFSCECGIKKPNQKIYQLAMEVLGVSAHQGIYVGDGGSSEFLGANQLGLQTVLTREFLKPVRYQKVLAEQEEAICHEIDRLQQLPGLIRSMKARDRFARSLGGI